MVPVDLGADFGSVLEGKADVPFAVNGYPLDHCPPEYRIEGSDEFWLFHQ